MGLSVEEIVSLAFVLFVWLAVLVGVVALARAAATGDAAQMESSSGLPLESGFTGFAR